MVEDERRPGTSGTMAAENEIGWIGCRESSHHEGDFEDDAIMDRQPVISTIKVGVKE